MKITKSYFLTSLLLTASFFSCGSSSNDEPKPSNPSDNPATITINPADMEIGADAQTVVINVKADSDWSIATSADWCTLFPTGGVKNVDTEIKVTVGANAGIDTRTAELVVTTANRATKSFTLTQTAKPSVILSTKALTFGAQQSSASVNVTSNVAWTATSSEAWCHATTANNDELTVTCDKNEGASTRKAVVTISYTGGSAELEISQLSDEIVTPEGYTLVWNDEFNDPALTMPDESKWWYEVWDPGRVNNELQRYIKGKRDGVVTAEVADGMLKIHAVKVGNEVWSARINTSTYWTYGYFEARLKLPKGKGTWPAFWMMPQTGGDNWPACGEIDIMEEVGVNPNRTSSSIHCTAYNHTIGTQKTNEVLTPGAEDEFHVYALEWTEDYIKTYVDGKLLLNFPNDHAGDPKTWPFNKNFGLKLNLAWGGDWGGMNGVDESALPATYEIDYVRVFQKN